jgi:hypothetical protein
MTAVTGIIRHRADEPFWAWSASRIELGPDQAIFFLRKCDRALVRVELSGTDPRTVRFEPGCEGLLVSRDFGVRLRLPCEFAGPMPGEIDAEVRLRLLDNAAEWPRRLPQMAIASPSGEIASPEQVLGRLVATLFEAEVAGLATGRAYAEFSRRLNDPLLLGEAEERLRCALARWTEEGIVSLLALHLLRVESQEGERQQRTSLEHRRLDQEHAQKLLRARQANELANLERQRVPAAPDEVRWRLFEPADLPPAGGRPPRLLKESSAPYEALVSGQHLQLFVRPVSAGHVYVLALGPYRTDATPEYRWMRLFGNAGRSDLSERAPRPGGNRLEVGETLLFPGDAGAAELFQHYLTIDAAPGWEHLVVAITPQALPDSSLGLDLPRPTRAQGDFRAFQHELNRGLQSVFGTDARIYLFQFFHS